MKPTTVGMCPSTSRLLRPAMTTMTAIISNKDRVCDAFSQLHWHDSRLSNLNLLKITEAKSYELQLDIDFIEVVAGRPYERNRRIITFKECRLIQLDLDLLGLLFCGGDISNAWCHKDAIGFEKDKRNKIEQFDFPQKHNPLDLCVGFQIQMVHPGGEIHVIARSFELNTPVPRSGRNPS